MVHLIKKISFFLNFLLVSIVSSSYADHAVSYYYPDNGYSENSYVLAELNLGYAENYHNQDGYYKNYLEDSRGNCCTQERKCGKIFACVDFLYLRAYESGLDVCTPCHASDTTLSDGRIISLFEGKGKDPRFEWNPGFRITGGYQISNHWVFAAFWTHFNSKTQSSKEGLHKLRWKINLDILDLIADYQCRLNDHFTLRPYFGLRGAKIFQKLDGGMFPDPTIFALGANRLRSGGKNKQEFWGGGPLFGLEADFNLGCGFGLYLNGSISWLYGHSDVKHVDSFATTDVIDFSRIKKEYDEILTSGDVAFGFFWQRNVLENKTFFITLGFEHHQFFDYNRISNGDLSFDGIELGIGFEY